MLDSLDIAKSVGISVQTLNIWYKFKEENPNNELVKYLPDYFRLGSRNKKYWNDDAIDLLKKFKELKPTGRKGYMGSVSQKYVKSSVYKNTNQYIGRIKTILKHENVNEEIASKIIEMLEEDAKQRNVKSLDEALLMKRLNWKERFMYELFGELIKVPEDFDEKYHKCLEMLKDNQVYLIEHWFEKEETLQEIANKFDCTRENIRSTKNRILRKIRKFEIFNKEEI